MTPLTSTCGPPCASDSERQACAVLWGPRKRLSARRSKAGPLEKERRPTPRTHGSFAGSAEGSAGPGTAADNTERTTPLLGAVFTCGPVFGASFSRGCSPCSHTCSLIDGFQEGVDFVLVLTSCPHSCPQTSLFLADTSASRVSICDGPFKSPLSHTLKPVSSSCCICTQLLPS